MHMNNTTTTARKTTSQLQAGDIVVTHGLRVRVNQNPSLGATTSFGDECWWTAGTVIKRLTNEVPMVWTANRTWTLKGTDMVTWTVEA